VSALLLAIKRVCNDAAQSRTPTKPNVWGPTFGRKVSVAATTTMKRRIPSLRNKQEVETRSRINSLLGTEVSCRYRHKAIETNNSEISNMRSQITDRCLRLGRCFLRYSLINLDVTLDYRVQPKVLKGSTCLINVYRKSYYATLVGDYPPLRLLSSTGST
jgi:hypothetical protein